MRKDVPPPGPESSKARVLLVEDDEALRAILEDELAEEGLAIRAVGSAEQALELLGREDVDLVVSDIRLPELDGLQLLRRTRKGPHPPSFLVITAFGTIDQAVSALKEGADDFLTKPLDLDHLSVRVARILENRRLRTEIRRYRDALGRNDFHGTVGRSQVMRDLFGQLQRIGRGRGPVLLQGESGVGKELAAKAIHAESDRSDGPFLAVNCAGVPASLLESEFFGHVKGAFSGAVADRSGLFQEAEGGTLLLDEIGEMPPELQAGLLRVLEGDEVRPVGSNRSVKVDVRVVAATNRDLTEALEQGHFRQDLFYRLETFRIQVPPLRDRNGDLELLAGHFIRRHTARLERDDCRASPAFLSALRAYGFPGNVRELENVVERAVTFCDGRTLQPRHLPPRVRAPGGAPTPTSPDGVAGERGPAGDLLAQVLADGSFPTLRELELRYVREVLEHTGGNKRRAAALLGIGRRTLYRKLDRPDGDRESRESPTS